MLARLCFLLAVIFVTYPVIFGQENVDEAIEICRKREKEFEAKEHKFRRKDKRPPEEPDLFEPQYKDKKISIYKSELIQRPFECLSDLLQKYNSSSVEGNDSYKKMEKECKSKQFQPKCDPDYPYRTHNGTCNNLDNPRWGASLACAARKTVAYYIGASGFRRSLCKNNSLPNPRKISKLYMSKLTIPLIPSSSHFIYFGQFLAHDISDTPVTFVGAKHLGCCKNRHLKEHHPQCEPILIEPDLDYVGPGFNVTCFNFIRGAMCDTCHIGKRSQMIEVSSYIDLSVVYGLDDTRNAALRANHSGLLRSRNHLPSGELMPKTKLIPPSRCGVHVVPAYGDVGVLRKKRDLTPVEVTESSKDAEETPESLKDSEEAEEATESSKVRKKRDLTPVEVTESSKDAEETTESLKDSEEATESSKDAEEATESSKDAEEATESSKDAEVATRSSKDAEEATESSKDAEVATESSKDAEEATENTKDAKEATDIAKEATDIAKEATEIVKEATESVKDAAQQHCFEGGDRRANQHTVLMIYHTVWLRNHNRIAKKLKLLNPHWKDEKLYQESRKINIAMFQVIVFKEYLPHLIGPKYMTESNLWLGNGIRTKYDRKLHTSIGVEFSAAAFRLHSMVDKKVGLLEPDLRYLFMDTSHLYLGEIEKYLKGLVTWSYNIYTKQMADDLHKFMYKEREGFLGFDLAAVNIQRGRDVGLPGYVDLVKFISHGKIDIKDFDGLSSVMTPEKILQLKDIYCHVRDIDAWIGLISETKEVGMRISTTAAKIIAHQFRNLKFGDRFYFEHEHPQHFNDEQLQQLAKTSLSGVFCDNTDDIKLLAFPPHSIESISLYNPFVPCKLIPKVDLSPWKE